MTKLKGATFDASSYVRKEELPFFNALIETIIRDGGNKERAYAAYPNIIAFFGVHFDQLVDAALEARNADFKEMTERMETRERSLREGAERAAAARRDTRGRLPR